MKNWAYIENGQIVDTFEDLPNNFRNISNLSASENNTVFLKTLGWYPIVRDNINYDTYTQYLISKGITFDGSIVKENYVVENTDTSVLYNNFLIQLRNKRDELLKASDYACLYDIAVSKGQEWIDKWSSYRQQLRDITTLYPNNGTIYYIHEVNWPVKPY